MSLKSEELRYVRFWYASTKIGKDVLSIIMHAYTAGKITTTFKDQLLAYYGLKLNPKNTPESLYKKDFTKDEQSLLENTTSSPSSFDVTLSSFDVTMSHKVLRRLQHLTKLADHNDKIWTEDNPPGTNKSIEHLIVRVKNERNNACHKLRGLSESELSKKLQELQDLYIDLIDNVLTVMGKSTDIISKTKDEIITKIKELKNPIHDGITDGDIEVFLNDKKDFMKKVQKETKEKCQIHLKKIYEDVYYSNPFEWLDIPYHIDREQIYTEVVIEEESLPFELSIKEKKMVKHSDIFNLKDKKLRTPRVITLNSKGGHGKTTSTRLFLYKWSKNNKTIPGLEEIEVLLYVELRNDSEKGFDEILHDHLINHVETGLSFQHVKNILLKSHMLVILDGQDEASHNVLLKDLLKLT
ncbi:unnamed protein product, partial [Meganyctiphanes norvegica]